MNLISAAIASLIHHRRALHIGLMALMLLLGACEPGEGGGGDGY